MVAIKKSKKNPPAGFKNQLMSLSKYKTWTKVLKEWLFVAYYRTNKYKTCPGDPRRINHLIVIRNTHTNRQLEICNSCAERYLELFDGGKIENEVRRLMTNTVLSMNQVSLDYLRTNYAISNYDYEGYQIVKGCRKDHNVLKFRSRINQKLLSLTDYNNKSSLDKIDCILVWIDKNPESDIDIKALFEIRENLLTANDSNTGFLDSIITDQKIYTEIFNESDRIIALKRFEEYLNVWRPEYDRLSKYFKKSSSGTNLEKVVKEISSGKRQNRKDIDLYKSVINLDECEYSSSENSYYNLDHQNDSTRLTTIDIQARDCFDINKNKENQQSKVEKKESDPEQIFTPKDNLGLRILLGYGNNVVARKALFIKKKGLKPMEWLDYIINEKRAQVKKHTEAHQKVLMEIEAESDTPVLDLISSDTLHKLSSFILNHLGKEVSNNTIDMIIDTFESDKISDVYYENPQITSLYDLFSKLNFGSIKEILTQLLTTRLKQLKVFIRDIFKDSMVCELTEIFSTERINIRYYDDVYKDFDRYIIDLDHYIPIKSWCYEIGPKLEHTSPKDMDHSRMDYMTSDVIVFECIEEIQNLGKACKSETGPVKTELDFSYLFSSDNNTSKEPKKDVRGVESDVERQWIEFHTRSIKHSKKYLRDLNKKEKDSNILILESIDSEILHKLELFILNHLESLTSNNSITMFVGVFDHIEIWDVYEMNPQITSLYDLLSKLSLACVKNVLIQLLSARLNQLEVRISDIFKNSMVVELIEILSEENLEIKYTGDIRPIENFYWKIESK